ncbi:hypothetical protein PUN28_017853 [Cardiocondyla obscurior]|uniref:Uncharacterized protein n=1 Tax=Cardiocondyla obscurior TaxID=286306 RepID=A0AAW2ENK9_9HYME
MIRLYNLNMISVGIDLYCRAVTPSGPVIRDTLEICLPFRCHPSCLLLLRRLVPGFLVVLCILGPCSYTPVAVFCL